MKPTQAGPPADPSLFSSRPHADPMEALARENAELRAKNDALTAEVARSADRVELLLSLGRAGTETLEVDALVDRVMALTIDALAVDSAMIHSLQNEKLVVLGVRTATGSPGAPGAREKIRALAVDEHSIAGRAVLARKTVIVDRSDWPATTAALAVTLSASFGAATPLTIGERMVGTLCVIRRRNEPFTADELRLLENSAAHIAAAIEHARLVDEERRRLRDLAAMNELGALIAQHLQLSAVLETGVRQLSQIADSAATFLMLFDGPEQLRVVASSGANSTEAADLVISLNGPSAVGEAIQMGGPVVIADTRSDPRASPDLATRFGYRTVLAVPLLSRGEAIGAVIAGESRAGQSFSPVQVSGVLAICNQLASAIVNARLYEAERKRADELALLLEIGRLITGSLDLDQILEAGAKSLARMVDASDVFLWLLDDASVLRGVTTASIEHREHFRSVRVTLDGNSLAAQSVRRRVPVQAEDALSSTEVNQDLNARYGMKSLLSIPLIVRDEAIGAIAVGDKTRIRTWTGPEIERATVVASHLGIAIANARLFDDLKQSYEELGEAQEALVARERLAALGELAAVVAHEVRNPLGIIWNSLGTLRRLLCPTGDVAMLLGIVGEESDRLNRIVYDLLDFARPYALDLRPEPLDAILAGAIDAARGAGETKPIEFVCSVDPSLPQVLADVRLLRQAFVNLVLNARQAMPKGGKVTVRATTDLSSGEERACVDVIDEGPGIPAEEAQHVFQPFYTTKATGTGLGLAVVKRIVLAHRGDVSVAPSVGRGTVFSVRLPFAPKDR